MTTLSLPALKSDDPLGFLASLGILEVLRSEVGVAESELGLGWEGVGGSALIEAPFASVSALAESLQSAAEEMHREGRLVPARLTELIPQTLSDRQRQAYQQRTGTKPPFDSARMSRAESAARLARLSVRSSQTDERWLCALVDQCSTFPGDDGSVAHLTPLYAPMGRQRLRQLYEAKLDAVASHPNLLLEACLMWRRDPRDAGVNLDRRAQRDASVTTNGQPGNSAVPGAEWLALQSAPWFRLGGLRNRPFAWGWVQARTRGRPRSLVWPVWNRVLDPVAIEVMITHPLVRRAGMGEPVRDRDLRALGVLAVLRADRTVLKNSDGPLGAASVVWPTNPALL